MLHPTIHILFEHLGKPWQASDNSDEGLLYIIKIQVNTSMFANPGINSKSIKRKWKVDMNPLGNMGSYENSGRTWYIASKIMQIASCATIHDTFTSPNLQALLMMIYCFKHEDLARKESRGNTRAVPWWSWPRDEHKHILTRSQSNLLNTSWKVNLLWWSEATTQLCLFFIMGDQKKGAIKKLNIAIKSSNQKLTHPCLPCHAHQNKQKTTNQYRKGDAFKVAGRILTKEILLQSSIFF